MTREQMKDKLDSILSGSPVQSFRLVEGGTLILYLAQGRLPRSGDQKSTRLWIESSWRLCTSDTVIVGSLDSPDVLLPQLQKLIGSTIDSVRLDGLPGDIRIILDSGVVIESFCRSVQNEQWQVRRDDGLRLGLRENLELYEAMVDPR